MTKMASFLIYIYILPQLKKKVTLHEGGLKSNHQCQRDTLERLPSEGRE